MGTRERETADYLTAAEVAAYLRVSTATVYRWLEAGKIPGAQVGKRTWRIRASDLEEYLGRESESRS